MNNIKIWIFKESGKWYTAEDVEIPAELVEVFQIVEFLQKNYHSYKGMHLVMPFTEEFINNGYPCMIPGYLREQVTANGNDVTWVDGTNDIITVCKLGDKEVFRIMKDGNEYYASYYNNRLFSTPRFLLEHLCMFFGKDLECNKEKLLAALKDVFLKDYRQHLQEQVTLMESMRI